MIAPKEQSRQIDKPNSVSLNWDGSHLSSKPILVYLSDLPRRIFQLRKALWAKRIHNMWNPSIFGLASNWVYPTFALKVP